MKRIFLLSVIMLIAHIALPQDATIQHNSSHKNNHFGWAITGNTEYCYISDPRDSITNSSNGSVNIYKKYNKTWSYLKTIQCPGRFPFEYFGYSISYLDNMLAVSGIGNDTKGFMSGAVYLYLQNGDSIKKVQDIYPSEMLKSGQFGKVVKLQTNLLIVGAPGAYGKGCVFIYKRVNDQFEFLQKISPPDLIEGSEFGSSIDCSDNMIYIGAPKGGQIDHREGAVYVYTIWNNQLTYIEKIKPDIDNMGSLFGFSISANKTRVLISAPHASTQKNEKFYFSGKAYLYENKGNGWLVIDSIENPTPASHDLFGSTVWLMDSSIIVSIPRSDDVKKDAGEVCIYRKISNNWVEESIKLNPPNGSSYFGNTLYVNNGGMWVGMSGNKNNLSVGTVYYYDFNNFNQIREEKYPEFNVYPNPVNDILTIELNEPGKSKYRLYEISGKTILTGSVHKQISSIDVSGLKAGMYILSLSGRKYCYTVKINKI